MLVINKSDINKSVINREINVHLSSDYWAYINWGTYSRGAYIRVGLYSGGAYIWNDVSVSTCGGLTHGGAYIWGGAYSRRFTVF